MSRRKQTRGVCAFCGRNLTGGGMSRHLATCSKRQEAIRAADESPGRRTRLLHLHLRDAWRENYWLYLEMDARAPMAHLDDYLRAIWLDCCGHMSAFFLGKPWLGRGVPMGAPAGRALQPDQKIYHLYDFGTTSTTLIRVVGAREGKPLTHHPIYLMARNSPPEYPCMECGQPARWFCWECQIEEDKSGLLCDLHLEDHPYEDYGPPVEIVNSPRMGLCGYAGPAEPPY